MSSPRSLAVKLILAMGIIQVIVCLAYFGVAYTGHLSQDCELCQRSYSNGLVISALDTRDNGEIYVRHRQPLEQLERRQPGFWFYVTDGVHVLEEGPVPAAARLMPASAQELLGKEEIPVDANGDPLWASTVWGTDAGILLVRSPRISVSSPMIVYWAWRSLKDMAGWLFLPLLLGALAAIALVVHGILGPVRTTAKIVDQVTFETRAAQVPSDGVPSEIAPLVAAVNRALVRLESGYERHKRFLANAAHELRTPLTALRLQLENIPPCEARERMTGVLRRVAALVEQLLALAHLEHGPLDIEDADLVAICRNVLADRAPVALASGVQVAFESPVSELRIRGVSAALYSAVANLIDNAIAHSERGQQVTVQVRPPGHISVIDHGAGFGKTDFEQLFEPFAKADARSPGVGLGLAIVREIMRLHRGRAEAMPTPGGGATFRLSFPG
ncbi:MAG TPA: HAMP domain-containing sensor histidine kinase [Steroidobacteraceae bacterium]